MLKPNSLRANIFSLSILQAFNYLLPLVTLPYLVRVLGVEQFGLLAFAMSLVLYFGVVMDYGFNLSAAREVSLHHANKPKIGEIFASVMAVKILLMLLSLLAVVMIVQSVGRFYEARYIYYASFAAVVAQSLFPVWLFQGLERLQFITLISVGSKIVSTLLLFVLVQTPEDAIWVPLLSALGFMLSALISFYLIFTRFGIGWVWPTSEQMRARVQESHDIFFANIAISLYTISTTFILGLFANNTVVGYFAAADKIIQAIKSMLMPLSQSIYPHISKLMQNSHAEALNFIRKIFRLLLIVMGMIGFLIFVLAPFGVPIILGDGYEESVLLVQIMAFLPLIIALSNLFGVQTMVNFGKKAEFRAILWRGSMLALGLSLVLVPLFGAMGSALCVVMVESFITLSMFWTLQKSDLKIVRSA